MICVCCSVVAGLVVSVVGDVSFLVVVLKVVVGVVVVFLVVWVFEEFWGGWPS